MTPAAKPMPSPASTVKQASPVAATPPTAVGPGRTPDMMHAIYEVARKEVLQHVRTKRLLIVAPIFILVMVVITIILPASFGNMFLRGIRNNTEVALENYVFLLFASGFFILSGFFYLQLLPMVLTVDSVCSEWSSRTIFLLLSKPVSRTSFVLGKFFGSAATVVVTVGPLMLLDYIVMDQFIPGGVDAGSFGRFLGFLGIVLLGCIAFTALSLLVSTLTRSMAAAYLMALAAWIFIFPLLGNLDTIVAVSQNGPAAFLAPSQYGVGWAVYLSPGESMRAAQNALAPHLGGADSAFIQRLFGFGAQGDPVWAAVALLVQTALFLGVSVLVVNRRNFE